MCSRAGSRCASMCASPRGASAQEAGALASSSLLLTLKRRKRQPEPRPDSGSLVVSRLPEHWPEAEATSHRPSCSKAENVTTLGYGHRAGEQQIQGSGLETCFKSI